MTCGSEYAPGLRGTRLSHDPATDGDPACASSFRCTSFADRSIQKSPSGHTQFDGTDRLSHAGIFRKDWTGDFFSGG